MNEQMTTKGLHRKDLTTHRKDFLAIVASRIKQDSNSNYRVPMKITHQHKELVDLLRTKLDLTSQLIIAIDGMMGVGKSSLARYLAWQLNVSVIETDLCRKLKNPNKPPYSNNGSMLIETDPELLYRLFQTRCEMGRSIIIEGINVLQSLEDANITADIYILIGNRGGCGS